MCVEFNAAKPVSYIRLWLYSGFLTGEACSTCTAVRVWSVVCGLCVIRKSVNAVWLDIVEEVIEVDEFDKGNTSAAAGIQDKY